MTVIKKMKKGSPDVKTLGLFMFYRYLLLANRVSLETLYIPMVKHSVLSIVPPGFSS